MLKQLRREYEEREKHKAMLKEFQHIGSGNSLSINSNFLDQYKREEELRRQEQIERERNKQMLLQQLKREQESGLRSNMLSDQFRKAEEERQRNKQILLEQLRREEEEERRRK